MSSTQIRARLAQFRFNSNLIIFKDPLQTLLLWDDNQLCVAKPILIVEVRLLPSFLGAVTYFMPEVFVVRLSFSISMNSRTVFPSAMHHYGARKSHRMFGSLVINFVCVCKRLLQLWMFVCFECGLLFIYSALLLNDGEKAELKARTMASKSFPTSHCEARKLSDPD